MFWRPVCVRTGFPCEMSSVGTLRKPTSNATRCLGQRPEEREQCLEAVVVGSAKRHGRALSILPVKLGGVNLHLISEVLAIKRT